MEAGEAGADYVAFGAFYPTETKDPAATRGTGTADLVAGDDGTALRRHRRDHHRERQAAGRSRGGFPCGFGRGLAGGRAVQAEAVKAFNTLFDELATW
jgi:hypothetical protein